MEVALQLYGALILTILAFVLPILTILLSLFSDGTEKLSIVYRNEKSQSETNLVNEVHKKETEKELDLIALQKTINTLKNKKREAERKLEFLQPRKVSIRISIPFALAFVLVLVATLLPRDWIFYIDILFSVIFLIYGVNTVWFTLSVLTEVADEVSKANRETSHQIIGFLSKLVENSSDDKSFIDANEINGIFAGKELVDATEFTYSANKKHKISISIANADVRMAKTVELGFRFPEAFLIEDYKRYSLLPQADETQILRLKVDSIQANTNQLGGDITITFMKEGEFDLNYWLSGENVHLKKGKFKIKVIE